MQITRVTAKGPPPLSNVDVPGLSDFVALAGPNGVGKTRLVQTLVGHIRNLATPSEVTLLVRATSKQERDAWGKDELDTAVGGDAAILQRTLNRPQRRGRWTSHLILFDDSRKFVSGGRTNSWKFADPEEEEIGAFHLLDNVETRQRETTSAMVRMVLHHALSVERQARTLQAQGRKELPKLSDPLERFQKTFYELLGPKELEPMEAGDIEIGQNVNDPSLFFTPKPGARRLPLTALSAGEIEVALMVFDLLLHNPRDCIVFIDEPELHLHPELSSRLMLALRRVGERNQFIVSTHSPDIISAALAKSLIFLSPRGVDGNQGLLIKPDDQSLPLLQELGQNLGVISLGRNIVLIEGKQQSLDKSTYSSLIEGRYPEFALSPSGGRSRLLAFNEAAGGVLERAVWGLNFFMLADRDNSLTGEELASLESKSKGRLRFLKRYHLENYFLDENLIAEVFKQMQEPSDWRCQPAEVRKRLIEAARASIPDATTLWANGLVRERVTRANGAINRGSDDSLEGIKAGIRPALEQALGSLPSVEQITDLVEARWQLLSQSLDSGDDAWKREIPGKQVLHRFCNAAGLEWDRLHRMYVAQARAKSSNCFQDITAVFDGFRSSIVGAT